jgi:hypothetical protein
MSPTVLSLVSLVACGPRELTSAATNPHAVGARGADPLLTTGMLKCRDSGTLTDTIVARSNYGSTLAIDAYPNAGSSFEMLIQTRVQGRHAELDRHAATVGCSKLTFMNTGNKWDTGMVWSSLIQDLAARTGAHSVLVPLVIVGDSGGQWTTTEFAAFLFADNGTLLWKSSGFADPSTSERVASRIVDAIPANLSVTPPSNAPPTGPTLGASTPQPAPELATATDLNVGPDCRALINAMCQRSGGPVPECTTRSMQNKAFATPEAAKVCKTRLRQLTH